MILNAIHFLDHLLAAGGFIAVYFVDLESIRAHIQHERLLYD